MTFLLGSSSLLRVVRYILCRANVSLKPSYDQHHTFYFFKSPLGLTYLGSFTFRALPFSEISTLGGFTFFFFSLNIRGRWEHAAGERKK